MQENSRISTQKAPKPVGLYPHARKVGNLLFLSGVGPRTAGSDDTDSGVPGLKLDKNGNFLEFDFEAIASASIAQVHKAKLHNGEAVAVKIMRPKIDKIMARDIKTIKLLTLLVLSLQIMNY